MIKQSKIAFPCRLRWGFFAFIIIIAVGAYSAPKIGFSIVKDGSRYKVHITGSSIGAIKSGEITCEYSTAVDIDNTLVHSPLSSVAISGSIDRTKHRVKIGLTTAGNVTIENAEIVSIDFTLSGQPEQSLFGVTSAVFTDPQGNVHNAEILPVKIISQQMVASGIQNHQVEKCFLLNGRAISQQRVIALRHEMLHGDVSLRIIKR
jgi:hypothetical protein